MGWSSAAPRGLLLSCRGGKTPYEKGANVNGKGWKEITALHRAAFKDCVDDIKILLDKGADINARDTMFQYSPLEWAALSGASRKVKIIATRKKEDIISLGFREGMVEVYDAGSTGMISDLVRRLNQLDPADWAEATAGYQIKR